MNLTRDPHTFQVERSFLIKIASSLRAKKYIASKQFMRAAALNSYDGVAVSNYLEKRNVIGWKMLRLNFALC